MTLPFINPIGTFNLYNSLTAKQKQELKRTTGGVPTQIIREALELSRMVTKPEEEEVQETEKFLKDLYSNIYGPENVVMKQRGDRQVATIARPESTAANIARDVGAFGASLIGVGKITKPLQALKAVKQATKAAPKTVRATSAIARGEAAVQLSIDPFNQNLANILGDMIEEDDGFLHDIETYVLDPVKSSQENSELENRIALLAEGLVLTGAVIGTFKGVKHGGKYIVDNTDKITNVSKPLINSLKSIRDAGGEPAQKFINAIKNKVDNKHLRNLAREGKGTDLETLQPGKLTSWLSTTNLKYSPSKILRKFEDFRLKSFTSRGGMSHALHRKYLKTENAKEKWDATIKHTVENLEGSINKIFKEVGIGKEELIEKVNYILFTDFRFPTIITSKGIKLALRQSDVFEKKLKELPEKLQAPVREARELQDKLSLMMTETKSVPKNLKKIYQENLGVYVRQAYKLFEDGKYYPPSSAIREAEEFLRTEVLRDFDAGKLDIKPTKKKPTLSEAKLELEVQGRIETIIGGRKNYNTFQNTQESLEKIRTQILKGRKNIPKPIKNLLGPLEDPFSRLINSTTKLAHYVENAKFYDEAWQMGRGIYFHPPKSNIAGFDVSIPAGFGQLTGKKTSKELASYFNAHAQAGTVITGDAWYSNLWRLAVAGKGLAQEMKTVGSINTHGKNAFGMTHMTMANGINPFANFGKTISLLKTQFVDVGHKQAKKNYEELARLGLIGKGVIVRDLKGMAQELDSVIKAGGPVKKNIAKFTDWLLEKTYLNPIRRGAKDVYVATDDYGKINMFFVEKDFLTKVNKLLPKGEQFNKYRLNSLEAIKQEAAEVVRRVMPNYDLVPTYIKKLRTIPITGRFFSFMSESVRITGNIYLRAFREIARGRELQKLGATEAGDLWFQKGMTRLGAMTAIGGLSGVALTKGTQAAYGLGQDAVNYAMTFAPEWMQNDKTVVALDPNGDPMLFNWSTWDAFDFPKKPFQVIINEYLHKDNYSEDELATRIFSTVTQELFTPFFGESITQEQISSYFIRNGRDIDGRLMRNPYNTSERYDNTGTYIENITGNLDILAGSMVQALEPGTITSFRRYGGTLDDNYNYKEQTDFGQTIHPELALFRAVTGVNFMPLNKEYLENMYSFEAIKFKQRKSDRWGELWNVVGKGYTKDDFLDRYLSVNQKYYNDFKRMQKFTESAEFFNLAPLSLLRDSGIGRTDRVALGVGKKRFFRPLGMTNNLRLSLLESESQKDDYFDIMTGIYQMNRVLSNLPILVDSEADVKNVPETFEELERQRNFKGGEISEDYPVTDVAKNPADRDLDNLPLSFNEVASNEQINPFTGEPYTALYSGRKQYNEGGSDRKKVLTYNQQYHEDTIKQGKVMINEHGQPVTANVIGVKHKGKIYNVPSYNRRGGFYTQEQAREVFKQDIEQGKIKGYLSEENKYSKEKGNIHLHPANIAAAEEHRMMDDATIPQESIAFNMQEDLQALHAHGRTNDMERLGFAKAGNVEEGSDRKKELNIVKEVLDKLDKDLDQDIKDNPKNYENKTNIKNKNPLNIIKTSIKWNNKLSDEESTDTTFEQFRTIFDGTRAGVLNVHAKFINTQPALGGRRATSISDMVDVLSPAVGDLPKYAHMELENPNNPNFKNYIAHRMGVGINDQLNFEDPKIMKAFVKAKTGFEGDNYELDDDLLTYSVQDAFKYKKDKGQYGQFNKVDLTNPPPPL